MMNGNSLPDVSTQDQQSEVEVSWWCLNVVKALAAIAAVMCLIFGVWSMISVTPRCIVAGVIQILLAFLVLLFEVPFCCQHFRYTQPISNFAKQQTYLRKAFIFAGMALIPVVLCFSMSTLFGCGMVFAVAVIYGLIALGKKADRETMMARASAFNDKAPIIPITQAN